MERLVFDIYDNQLGRDAILGHCELECENIRECLVDGVSIVEVPILQESGVAVGKKRLSQCSNHVSKGIFMRTRQKQKCAAFV